MIAEIVGGPKDGQQIEVNGHVLVIPEPSSSIGDWIEAQDPTIPMPTFKEVRYTIMEWHGRMCAVHPGVSEL